LLGSWLNFLEADWISWKLTELLGNWLNGLTAQTDESCTTSRMTRKLVTQRPKWHESWLNDSQKRTSKVVLQARPNQLQRGSLWYWKQFMLALVGRVWLARLTSKAFSGFSVGCCINREKGYLLPTWAQKITCRRFNWMLQSSSGQKWKKCVQTLLFIAIHYWGYTSLEVKGQWGLLLPPCLLITAVQQPGTSSPPSRLKCSSAGVIWMCRASFTNSSCPLPWSSTVVSSQWIGWWCSHTCSATADFSIIPLKLKNWLASFPDCVSQFFPVNFRWYTWKTLDSEVLSCSVHV